MANEETGVYEPGTDITFTASATVVGKRCLSVSGDRGADGLIRCATTAAGARAHGVSAFDVASGGQGVLKRGNSRVLLVTATNATIAAGADVEVGANGMVQTKNTGIAIGYAIANCAANGDAQISLY